jgi:PadR family transcriptional regulator
VLLRIQPALHRLEHQGPIVAEWGESKNKRRAKDYTLVQSSKFKIQNSK